MQLSASSITTATSTAGISDAQSTVVVAGFEAVGFVSSFTVIICSTSIEFPQSSVIL